MPSLANRWKRLTRRTISRQVMWSPWRREVKQVSSILATSASETHRPSASSQTALGYLIVLQASGPMAAIADLTWASIRAVTENQAPARQAAAMKLWV